MMISMVSKILISKISVTKIVISSIFASSILTFAGASYAQTPAACSNSALDNFVKHTAAAGETVGKIAQRYNISSKTVMAMNPRLRNRQVTPGQEILIPPYDGIVVEVRRGQTWREIARQYQVRADTLFELNGCKPPKDIAFIPTAKISSSIAANRDRQSPVSDNRNPSGVAANSTPNRFSINPLTIPNSQITLPYGWQTNPRNGEAFFHSGVDLLANVGTPVQSVADGVVAFVGEQGTYGKLVIINHRDGLQTRYAHLSATQVQLGQPVKAGAEIGKVGTSGQPASKEPHLHFEVRISSDLGWAAKEPKDYLPTIQK